MSVEVISPQRGRIETVIRVTGDIVNDRTVKMAALVDGQIQKMPVRKGDSVKAGQILTVLDTCPCSAFWWSTTTRRDRSRTGE